MELLSEKQVTELAVGEYFVDSHWNLNLKFIKKNLEFIQTHCIISLKVYENRVKAIVEKIKDELRNRKELKKKLEEAKQRESLQIQVLDRYDRLHISFRIEGFLLMIY